MKHIKRRRNDGQKRNINFETKRRRKERFVNFDLKGFTFRLATEITAKTSPFRL